MSVCFAQSHQNESHACTNESRLPFLLTLPLILLRLDPYHHYHVCNGWQLNRLCGRWRELAGLMLNYSTLKVTADRKEKGKL